MLILVREEETDSGEDSSDVCPFVADWFTEDELETVPEEGTVVGTLETLLEPTEDIACVCEVFELPVD